MTDNGPSHIKPRIFIGSSTPGLDVAYTIQRRLKDIAKVKVWKEEDCDRHI